MAIPVDMSIIKTRNETLLYGVICCTCCIIFLLVMKYMNSLEHSGFRLVNYLIILLVTFIQVRTKIKQKGEYIPFLQVFSTVFFTGTLSSVLFSVFLFVYAFFDPLLSKLLIHNAPEFLRAAPAIVLLFEGTGVSIIIALINMVYFTKFEENIKA
ncbi:MAG: DUF4199 domain-containing protein [Bacteroidia bacterium]